MQVHEALRGSQRLSRETDSCEHVKQQSQGFAGIWPVGSRMLYHYVMNVLLLLYCRLVAGRRLKKFKIVRLYLRLKQAKNRKEEEKKKKHLTRYTLF